MNADLIRAGMIDLDAIHRAGKLADLRDDLDAARRQYRERERNATNGDLARWPTIADQLAKLAELDPDDCQNVADEITSWPTTALRVIQRHAADSRRKGGAK